MENDDVAAEGLDVVVDRYIALFLKLRQTPPPQAGEYEHLEKMPEPRRHTTLRVPTLERVSKRGSGKRNGVEVCWNIGVDDKRNGVAALVKVPDGLDGYGSTASTNHIPRGNSDAQRTDRYLVSAGEVRWHYLGCTRRHICSTIHRAPRRRSR
ncbi:hypothetical protein [Niveibacterium microcysteis]|uniref:hypothetical protein n=1 Tax=Niveibacterium microcysteis TaxID=2811415 RepID=UPI0031B6508D